MTDISRNTSAWINGLVSVNAPIRISKTRKCEAGLSEQNWPKGAIIICGASWDCSFIYPVGFNTHRLVLLYFCTNVQIFVFQIEYCTRCDSIFSWLLWFMAYNALKQQISKEEKCLKILPEAVHVEKVGGIWRGRCSLAQTSETNGQLHWTGKKPAELVSENLYH